MKRLALLSVAIVLATAVNLRAGEANAPIPPHRRQGRTGPAGGPCCNPSRLAQWYIESLDPIVGLTDQQKKAITEVIESRDKAMREFQSKHAEKLAAASKAMSEAYQKNDKEAIAKAQKAYQEALRPVPSSHEGFAEETGRHPHAPAKGEASRPPDGDLDQGFDRPDRAQRGAKTEGQGRFPRDAEVHRSREDGVAGCRRPSSRSSLPNSGSPSTSTALGSYVKAMFARVKLTDEQNKKVEALLDKICQDPNLSVDWKTYQSVSKKVEELLTAEQKETLKRPLNLSGQAGGQRCVT